MKNRPIVNITKDNCLEELLDALYKNLHRFKEFDGIAGIMLDGGLSRGYGDRLSEIDVVIFLHDEAYRSYQEKKTPVSLGITMLDGYLYDVKLLNYEEELQREYDSVSLWDLSYAKIVYDEKGELKALFDQKLATKVVESKGEGLMFEAWWSYKLAGDIWIYREDPVQGHYCLNNAIKPLISCLYIANREYIPHEKWLLHMSHSLPWKPENYESRLAAILSTGDMSMESLRTRQKSIEQLWLEIDSYLCEKVGFKEGLNLMHKGVYTTLNKAVEKGDIPIEEWKQFSSLSALNYEPLHTVAKLTNTHVVIDKEKLETIEEREMYEWFLDIVKNVRQKKQENMI